MNDYSAIVTVITYLLTFVVGQVTGFVLARLMRFTDEKEEDGTAPRLRVVSGGRR